MMKRLLIMLLGVGLWAAVTGCATVRKDEHVEAQMDGAGQQDERERALESDLTPDERILIREILDEVMRTVASEEDSPASDEFVDDEFLITVRVYDKRLYRAVASIVRRWMRSDRQF